MSWIENVRTLEQIFLREQRDTKGSRARSTRPPYVMTELGLGHARTLGGGLWPGLAHVQNLDTRSQMGPSRTDILIPQSQRPSLALEFTQFTK